jgi:phosphoribosylanthranilate isomerase
MTSLKLCGIRSLEDYQTVAQNDVDYVGFVFATSKRRVTPEQVDTIITSSSQKTDVKHVGVFVNPSMNEVIKTTSLINLDVLQFHGDEGVDFIKQVQKVVKREIWKAIPHGPGTGMRMLAFADVVDGFVIDTRVDGKYGGTGVRFDWRSIPDYSQLAAPIQKKCFIAGGITPENVSECLSYGPQGIDVSSGIEKGSQKDHMRLNLLLERMKAYETSQA